MADGGMRRSRKRPSCAGGLALAACAAAALAAALRHVPAFAAVAAKEKKGRKQELEVGKDFTGRVKKLIQHGAIVTMDDFERDGFAHVSELTTLYARYLKQPSDMYSQGDKVRVRVIKLTEDRLELSVRQAGRKLGSEFLVGQDTDGTVIRVEEDGAWVDISLARNKFQKVPLAWLHKAQFQDGYVDDAREYLQAGDEVKAWVCKKEETDNKGWWIEVSMKSQEAKIPLAKVDLAELRVGQEMGGRVTSVRDFGCFVDVGAEADGLVHVRNINDGIVPDIDELIKHGDPLIVRVLREPEGNDGKLELELASPLPRLPDVSEWVDVNRSAWLDAEVQGVAEFGAFVSLEHPGAGPKVTALLGMSHVKDGATGLAWMSQRSGPIKVRVIQVDVEKKQVRVTQLEPLSKQRTEE